MGNLQPFHPWPTLQFNKLIRDNLSKFRDIKNTSVITIHFTLGAWMEINYKKKGKFICDLTDDQIAFELMLSPSTVKKGIRKLKQLGFIKLHKHTTSEGRKRWIEGIPLKTIDPSLFEEGGE